jgi:hypothetical protein
VKIARLYLGKPDAHWPTPRLDLAFAPAAYSTRNKTFTASKLPGCLADLLFIGGNR